MGTFTDQLGGIAAGAIGTVANTGLGLLLEGHNDRRQIRQQQKLQNMQIAGSKELTDYNQQKQLDLWEKTNYGAQRKQLEAAGLNAALLYGQSGGGGATANISSGSVSGGNAPMGGGEILALQQLGLQREMQQAQIANVKADTKGKEIQNETEGAFAYETAYNVLKKARSEVSSAESKALIDKYETEIKKWDAHYAETNALNNANTIAEKLSNLEQINQGLMYDNEIKGDTLEELKKEVRIRINEGAARIALIDSNIKMNQEQATKWATELEQRWKEIEQGNTKLQQTDRSLDQDDTRIIQGWAELGVDALESIIGFIPSKASRKIVETLVKTKGKSIKTTIETKKGK